MKSDTSTVQQQFQDRRQYRIPFFQRAYVWNKHSQWVPLWDDILVKSEARLASDPSAPHFLGAIVLEPQIKDSLRGVETLHVIDGQQRLSTLQYVLAALVMAMHDEGMEAISSLIKDCLWNPNPETMEQPEVEKFKVWPTFRDRNNYQAAMTATTQEELRERFPDSFTQRGSLRQIGISHPPALEAIWFFRQRIQDWLSVNEDEKTSRLEALAGALLRDLKFVWIMLDDNDDAQVIFETLNGRGAELHATDLIRNFIFLRADREKSDSGFLYDNKWRPFEEPFWSENQRRGRLNRPRLEWFVQTALQSEMGDEVEIGNLYAGYKKYATGSAAVVSAVAQLDMLSGYSAKYRQLVTGKGPDSIANFGGKIGPWDASATHSVAIRVARSQLSREQQSEVFSDLLSYMVRRAVCGLTTKNYNKVFHQLLKRLNENDSLTPSIFRLYLSETKGDASRWPDDREFSRAWSTGDAIKNVGTPGRVKAILVELENGIRSPRTEEPYGGDAGNLDVDHIMPRSWYKHWQLNDETITYEEARNALDEQYSASELATRRDSILRREVLVQTMGNLTLVHYGVNRSLQNREFVKKKKAFADTSNLHLNRTIMIAEKWDEESISERGQALLETALKIWRGPIEPSSEPSFKGSPELSAVLPTPPECAETQVEC